MDSKLKTGVKQVVEVGLICKQIINKVSPRLVTLTACQLLGMLHTLQVCAIFRKLSPCLYLVMAIFLEAFPGCLQVPITDKHDIKEVHKHF